MRSLDWCRGCPKLGHHVRGEWDMWRCHAVRLGTGVSSCAIPPFVYEEWATTKVFEAWEIPKECPELTIGEVGVLDEEPEGHQAKQDWAIPF